MKVDAEIVLPELVEKNQLVEIVQKSGLEQSKAKFILEQFKDYFDMADEWSHKARAIVVTSPAQEGDMKLARTGRLFLREKRLAIEAARKELKEQSLCEGKAIDGIANVLKALIIPIEDYLDRQENFVEIQKKAEAEAVRLEVERKMEADRIAKEQAEAQERERLRIENERLRQEKVEQDRLLAAERAETQRQQREAEAKARADQDAIRRENDRVVAAERANRERVEKELREQKQAAARILEQEKQKAEALKMASDSEKLKKLAADISSIQMPEMSSDKAKAIVHEVKGLFKELVNLLHIEDQQDDEIIF